MPFLPISKQEFESRGITPDFIMVSADAYVDHPSFGHALIARLVESFGYTVGIIAQPVSEEDYKALGAPAYAFMVSGGVVDSMVNNYTAAKKKRSTDEYSAGGRAGKRPDRAVTVYTKTLKRLFPDTPVIIGGIEASLRRFAHYDYWKDCVMPSILYDSGADLLVYGMGEKPVAEILEAAGRGIPVGRIRHIRGTAYADRYENLSKAMQGCINGKNDEYILINSFEEVSADKVLYAKSFNTQSQNTDAISGKGIIQPQKNGLYAVINPPQFPLTVSECDRAFDLPYEKNYHPSYESAGGVPAIEEVKFSIISHRGCFGSCAFCAINYHQGRSIQKRSDESVVSEAQRLTTLNGFKGYIHDVGGPTANFHEVSCEKQKTSGVCRDKYCIGNTPCKNLTVSHASYLALLQKIRSLPNIKKVFIRSGIRFDYLMMDKNEQFFNELCKYHISGQLKVAPEHVSERVLKLMNKPSHSVYKQFTEKFKAVNQRLKLPQFTVPYFISSLPGCTLNDAVNLALYLKSINYMPKQVQDFYPTPSTRAACMYYTGLDPDTMQQVYTAKTAKEKAMQRALLQYSRPENRRLVEEALRLCGREDLIGFGKNCLIQPFLKQGGKKSPFYKDKTYKGGKKQKRQN